MHESSHLDEEQSYLELGEAVLIQIPAGSENAQADYEGVDSKCVGTVHACGMHTRHIYAHVHIRT
jgi:hypothetical protein